MADINIDFKNINLKAIMELPSWARNLIAVVPSVLIVVFVVFLAVMPKNKQIGVLKQEIAKQEAEIAKSQSMAARLDELKAENERLKGKLKELEEQLPAEDEISSLLKQVSDLGINAELQILTWRPAPKRNHPSKIVYEVPVGVSLKGSYHRLGLFFSSLTKLDRIVNIFDITLSSPTVVGKEVVLSISFNAVTFTAVEGGGILQ